MRPSESDIRRALEARTEDMSSAFRDRLASVIAQGRPRTNLLPTLAAAMAVVIAVSTIAILVGTRQLQSIRTSLAGPSPASTSTPLTVPWAAVPAPNQVLPITLPRVSACRASDLSVDVHAEPSYIGSGPLNTSTWNIAIQNVHSAPCFVGSTVWVEFVTGAGALDVAALRRVGGDIIYLAPDKGPSGYGLWDKALGEIDTFPCVLPAIAEMRISPGPGLGSVAVSPGPAGGVGSPCPQKQSYLAELWPDTDIVGYAAAVQTSLDVAATAHPGQHFRFVVTLTNAPVAHHEPAGTARPTPSPLTFNPCPTYHVELEGVAGTLYTSSLNCHQAQTIPANGKESFEMFIDVPEDALPGPAVLYWAMDGSPLAYQAYKVAIQIE